LPGRLRAMAGIVAPFDPVLVGLASPVTAPVVMVTTPVFYAATAGGLRIPRRPAAPRAPAAEDH
jgi:hypothetical protein